MVKGNFSMYKDPHALELLNEPASHGPAKLVKIAEAAHAFEETNA